VLRATVKGDADGFSSGRFRADTSIWIFAISLIFAIIAILIRYAGVRVRS
jgi:hypothetical protein